MGTSINPPPTMDETTKQNNLDNDCETTPMDDYWYHLTMWTYMTQWEESLNNSWRLIRLPMLR